MSVGRALLLTLAAAMLIPVVFVLVWGSGDPATMWSTLGVITGTQACVALLATLIAVARVRKLTERLGIDGTMAVHRTLGGATVALATVHVVAVVADNPANIWLLDSSVAPGRAFAGTAALLLLGLLFAFAERRVRRYEWWRWIHRTVASLAVVAVFLHVWWLERLLGTPAWASLFVLVAVAAAVAFCWRWTVPYRRRRFVVTDVRDETPTVSTLALLPAGEPLHHDAGQFAWLRLRSGPWNQDHPFTIASAADSRRVEFTFRHAGDWTTGPLRRLRPGDVVWLDGPHGGMTLTRAENAAALVMIGAGVGLTPIMSMLRTCAERGDTRAIIVIVPPGEPLFADELAALATRLDLTVARVLTRPVTASALADTIADTVWPPHAAYYVCGPPAMVTDTLTALRTLDIPADRVHSERFAIA